MLKSNIIIISLLISGCATTEPTIKVVTERVEIPIPVFCKEEIPKEPNYCFAKLEDSADIFEKTKCLLSDRALSLGYEIELVSKLKACK